MHVKVRLRREGRGGYIDLHGRDKNVTGPLFLPAPVLILAFVAVASASTAKHAGTPCIAPRQPPPQHSPETPPAPHTSNTPSTTHQHHTPAAHTRTTLPFPPRSPVPCLPVISLSATARAAVAAAYALSVATKMGTSVSAGAVPTTRGPLALSGMDWDNDPRQCQQQQQQQQHVQQHVQQEKQEKHEQQPSSQSPQLSSTTARLVADAKTLTVVLERAAQQQQQRLVLS